MRRQSMLDSIRRHLPVLTAAGVLATTMVFAPAPGAADSPAEFGAAQLPYVFILLDTSASMQWTDKGDERYPTLDDPSLTSARNLATWTAGTRLNLDTPSSAVQTVGPCQVWAPQCNSYERPAWCASNECPWLDTPAYTGDANAMRNRLQTMRNEPHYRLTSDNLPRHVMLKEVLTGDMILLDSTGGMTTRESHGPGCWFVPRFRSAMLEDQICENNARFEMLLDYDDPRPHIQEVYDHQLPNGLLDTMSSSAIFAVGMFDGYRFAARGPDGRDWGMDDIIAGSSVLPAGSSEDEYSAREIDGLNYDLGIYRVVGPRRLDIPASYLQAVSAFTQMAIADAGYVNMAHPPTGKGADSRVQQSYVLNPERTVKTDASSWPHLTVPPGFEMYMDRYTLGKQPIARATPFAGAVHDIHQYLLNGQYRENDTFWTRGQDRRTAEVSNPFILENDPYRACRPKHVVLLTDGYPEPEAPGGAGDGLGSENLVPAFGYDADRYPYPITEELIKNLVEDSDIGVDMGGTYKAFHPRVHVVGVNVLEDGAANQAQVIDKIAEMARNGRTCAQYYLDKKYLPVGVVNGEGETGTCNPDDGDTCLIPQDGGAFTSFPFYPPRDFDNPNVFECAHPALIFNKNDKATIREALSLMINHIVSESGLSARTRPAVTSYLDDGETRGQYRIYSGMRMDGLSPYWKGILNRQLLSCEATSAEVNTPTNPADWGELVRMHDEINRLRNTRTSWDEERLVDRDSRRVFTAVPTKGSYDAAANRANDQFDTQLNLVSRFDLTPAPGRDEFGDTYISEGPLINTGALVGGRIPFEYERLLTAYTKDPVHSPFTTDSPDDRALYFHSYFQLNDLSTADNAKKAFERLVDEVRGRIPEKRDRLLGGIFHSNPVIVGPPDLDLPIDSYRAFRARFADRPTMLYVGTLDGMLHAIYTGRPNVPVREPRQPGSAGGTGADSPMPATIPDVFPQREAWAYVPHMLHRKLAWYAGAQPNLLDGTPVVTDIRLCSTNPAHNVNEQACGILGDTIADADQWRTVLVQGLGSYGRGYFALDVTRTGSKTQNPDPIPLWEFDETWELGQIEALERHGLSNRYGTNNLISVSDCGLTIGSITVGSDYSKLPYLGRSVGEAVMGTIVYQPGDAEEQRTQRAIAMFGAGSSADVNDEFSHCRPERIGKAIYVVDLQTGSILRRFVDYIDDEGNSHSFAADIIGTPVLFDNFPGTVATRGFIGDAEGRLYRVDMSRPKPEHWRVTLFFDPATDTTNFSKYSAGDTFGPAAFRPAIAMSPERNVVVIYGLGERGDTSTSGQTQFMIALEERFEGASYKPQSELLWRQRLDEGEKLTGEPVIFNNAVYFTTYHQEDAADRCQPGTARIYGLSFLPETGVEPRGVWTGTDISGEGVVVDPADNPKWFGPAQPTLIRGVTVTMGPACSVGFDDSSNQQFHEQSSRRPQLIAQSGAADPGDVADPRRETTAGGDHINRIAVDLDPPHSQTIPLSWTIIGN